MFKYKESFISKHLENITNQLLYHYKFFVIFKASHSWSKQMYDYFVMFFKHYLFNGILFSFLSKMYQYITNEAKQDRTLHIRGLENITALPVKCITFMGL